jgi:hypothetical protein
VLGLGAFAASGTAAPGDPQCADGTDNDVDGLTDFPDDPDCQNPADDSEAPDVVETPTPTPTATPTAEPTVTPTAEPTATATATAGPIATAEPTATAAPAPSPDAQATAGFVLVQPAAPVTTTAAARPVATVVVRIAGSVTTRGTKVRVLSVRAPVGASVVARCAGRCPVRTKRVRTAASTVRLRAFERTLRPHTVLVVRVRVSGMVGRYTSLTMRQAKPPARRDACLPAHGSRPVAC